MGFQDSYSAIEGLYVNCVRNYIVEAMDSDSAEAAFLRFRDFDLVQHEAGGSKFPLITENKDSFDEFDLQACTKSLTFLTRQAAYFDLLARNAADAQAFRKSHSDVLSELHGLVKFRNNKVGHNSHTRDGRAEIVEGARKECAVVSALFADRTYRTDDGAVHSYAEEMSALLKTLMREKDLQTFALRDLLEPELYEQLDFDKLRKARPNDDVSVRAEGITVETVDDADKLKEEITDLIDMGLFAKDADREQPSPVKTQPEPVKGQRVVRRSLSFFLGGDPADCDVENWDRFLWYHGIDHDILNDSFDRYGNNIWISTVNPRETIELLQQYAKPKAAPAPAPVSPAAPAPRKQQKLISTVPMPSAEKQTFRQDSLRDRDPSDPASPQPGPKKQQDSLRDRDPSDPASPQLGPKKQPEVKQPVKPASEKPASGQSSKKRTVRKPVLFGILGLLAAAGAILLVVLLVGKGKGSDRTEQAGQNLQTAAIAEGTAAPEGTPAPENPRIEYDENGNKVKETKTNDDGSRVETEYSKDGSVTEHVFDTNGNEIKTSWRSPEGDSSSTIETEYDENGRAIKQNAVFSDDTPDYRSEFEYDENGSKIMETRYYQNGDKTEFEFDQNGNWAKQRSYSADGSVREYVYDTYGRECKTIQYNPDGSVERSSETEYDERGCAIKETQFNADGSPLYWTEYEYDENGNKVHQTEYDSDGRIGEQYQFTYDENGNLRKKTLYAAYGSGWTNKPKTKYGIRLQSEYDETGRLIREKRSYAEDYSIDECWEQDEYEYDVNGILIRITTTHDSTNDNGFPCTISEFDAEGNRKEASYDSYGRIWRLEEYDSSDTIIRRTEYNEDGSIRYREEYEYDENGKLLASTVYDAEGNVKWIHKYFYDADGNRRGDRLYNPDGTPYNP